MRHEKLIVVTRKTALAELIERFNTREQARFYIEHMGGSFEEYQDAHDRYYESLAVLKEALPPGLRAQFIDRDFLPSFTFGGDDLVATLGQDGLVVNTAKYLEGQPLLAFNPDARRIDGILLPFHIHRAREVLPFAVNGGLRMKRISMARVDLNDGQSLHAVNDFFIGPKSHVSARYSIRFGELCENHSSSGIIVSTGAGSTGWLRSIVTGAAGVVGAPAVINASYHRHPAEGDDASPPQTIGTDCRFDWESPELVFAVREPFPSRTSQAQLVFGRIAPGQSLELTSQMPQNGVIFSDGIEDDYLEFNAGSIARIALADKKLHLVVG